MTKDEALKLALEALESASNAIESWGSYASEYFQDKHDLQVDINNTQKAITSIKEALALQEYDYKDLYEKEKRKSAMWLAKYEEVAGTAPKAIPMAQPEQELCTKVECMGSNGCIGNCWNKKLPQQELVCVCGAVWEGQELVVAPSEDPPQCTWVGLTDDEVENLCLSIGAEPIEVRFIEAKLKAKNT